MMGYDEPSSKRTATAATVTSATSGPANFAPSSRGSRVRKPRYILVVALAVVALGYYLGTRYDLTDPLGALQSLVGGPSTAGRGRVQQDAPVRVATAESHAVPILVRTIGTVLANSTVTVKTQVDGPLVSAMFKEGQMVKKGDLLFRIDPAPFEAALRQSEAQMERDRAQLASASADAERAIMLSDRGIVSTQQRDQLVAMQKALQATVAADQAAVDRAQLNLGYTTIRSPIDGKTGPYIVYPGNQIHANDAAGLVTITQIQPVKITFNLPQGNLPQLQARLRENQLIAEVSVRSDVAGIQVAGDQMEKAIPVKVDFIGNVVDARTGTIELRATFDNPDLRLVPGELVDVSVRLETLPNAITVPREAVNIGQNGNYVFVVGSDMKAQTRPVDVLYQDQNIAALGSGIKVGDMVVTDGQLRLSPGTRVVIAEDSGAQSASAQNPASPPSGASETTGATSANPQGAGRRGRGG
jgi:multidrug efflux system membrane fusion protein